MPTSRPGPAAAARRRTPLPRDPSHVAPLPPAFWETLDGALRELDLELSPGMREAIAAHARLLLGWAPYVNLTAIRAPGDVAREHVADSLAALPVLLRWIGAGSSARRAPRLVDLGSGAGYPGLPLALALPVASATLVDAIGKKAEFLRAATAAAGAAAELHGEPVPELHVLGTRIEDLAGPSGRRGAWDVATARAVAPLDELLELAMPLLRRDGILLAWKRDAGDGAFPAELERAARLAPLVGADTRFRVEPVAVDGLADHRLVVCTKRRPTPARFPRPPGARRPPLIR